MSRSSLGTFAWFVIALSVYGRVVALSAIFRGVCRVGGRNAGRARRAGRVTAEDCEGGHDSRVPRADKFPCPRDPYDQRGGHGVADQLQWGGEVRISQQGNAGNKFRTADQQQQRGRP